MSRRGICFWAAKAALFSGLCLLAIQGSARAQQSDRDISRAGKLIGRGQRHLEAGNYTSAIAFFEEAARVDPQSAEAYAQMGHAYGRMALESGLPLGIDAKKNARGAVDAYQTALALDPELRSVQDGFSVHHGLAQCQEALGRHAEALQSVRRTIRMNPDNPMPYLYAARLRYMMEDLKGCSADFHTAIQRARRTGVYPSLARLLRSDSPFSDLLYLPENQLILRTYDAVEDGRLGEREALARIRAGAGFAVARAPRPEGSDLRDAVAARPAFQASASRLKRNPSAKGRPSSRVYVQRGDRHFESGRYEEAIRYYQTALEANDANGDLKAAEKARVWERIGTSNRMLNRSEEAEQTLNAALYSAPQNASARYQLALNHAANGEAGKALSELHRALRCAASKTELRKLLLQARTDREFEPFRRMPRYKEIVNSYSKRLI